MEIQRRELCGTWKVLKGLVGNVSPEGSPGEVGVGWDIQRSLRRKRRPESNSGRRSYLKKQSQEGMIVPRFQPSPEVSRKRMRIGPCWL